MRREKLEKSHALRCGEIGEVWGLRLSHDYSTARYGNRSHLDSQRISGLEGVCDMLIVGGMGCVGKEGACQSSVGLYVSQEVSGSWSSSSAPRHSTFAQSLAASACSLSPARRVLHAARILHTRYFTLQTSRLGRISLSLRFYDSGMRKMNTMITALVPARCTCIQSPPTERAEQG